MIRRLLPLTLAGFLLACGGAADSVPAAEEVAPTATTATAPTASTPATDATTGATTGAVVADAPEALQFSAPLLGGGDIELATLAGRPVLLWFWAPW